MTAQPPELFPATPPLRILVVDDNIDGAETLCELLRSMGCTTAVAFDGAQGLATAAQFDPHLALIDLEMPGMNGLELARHLRASQPRSAAWLVCLTGRGRPDDRRLSEDVGFDEFFTKPIQMQNLVRLVADTTAALQRQ